MTNRHYLFLILILAYAGITRLIGINWDAKAHLHPDERFLTMVASTITIPRNIIEYFDTNTSPANPQNRGFSFYVYGTYPMHLVKLLAILLGKDTYDEIVIVGRAVSVAVDLLTVLVVFSMGAILGKPRHRHLIGLFAALCYALSVLPIQLSHFFTVDPFVTLAIASTLLLFIRGRLGLVAGVFTGLAVAAKISAVLILPVLAVNYIVLWPWKGHSPIVWKHRKQLLLNAITCIFGFLTTIRLAYPYLFNGHRFNPLILANWKQLASFDGPTTSFPPGLQWITVPAWQPIVDMIVFGFGIPLSLLAVASILRLVRSIWKKPYWQPETILLLWILLLIGYQSNQFAKPMRYFWAAYPALSVFAGMGLFELYRLVTIRIHAPYLRHIIYSIIGLTLFVWPLAFLSIYRHTNTRVAASTWIYTHIPPHSTIAWEHWDDPLPFTVEPYTPTLYTQIQLPSFDPDDAEKTGKIQEVLSQSDYLVLSSNRAYGALNRAKARFPKTNLFYQQLFAGKLGFRLVAQFVSRPFIPLPVTNTCIHIPGFTYGNLSKSLETCDRRGISFVDDYADETFTVYDHPKVLIFQKMTD